VTLPAGPSAAEGSTAPPPLPRRQSLGSLASTTTVWLSLSIVVSACGVFLVLTAGAYAPGIKGLVNALWALVTCVISICFLRWLSRARRNAATYGPGGVGRYPNWTVGGWLCPVVNLWVPYRIVADLVRASMPVPGTPTVLAAPPPRPAAAGVLRGWFVLWHGMWVAFLTASFDSAFIESSWLAELAFLVLSIGAASCAIVMVVTVTSWQDRREADPFYRAVIVPRAAPSWFWAAGLGFVIVFILLGRDLSVGPLAPFKDLFVP